MCSVHSPTKSTDIFNAVMNAEEEFFGCGKLFSVVRSDVKPIKRTLNDIAKLLKEIKSV